MTRTVFPSMRLFLACTLFLTASLLSCQSQESPKQESHDSMAREQFYITKSSGKDTLSYASSLAELSRLNLSSTDSLKAQLKQMRTILSATLNRLGYGSGRFTWKFGPREKEGLQRFQKDLGIAVTGELDSLTIHCIMEASNALDINRIVLPPFRFHYYADVLFASGTWKAIDNNIYYKYNFIDICCRRLSQECDIVTANFDPDNLDQIF